MIIFHYLLIIVFVFLLIYILFIKNSLLITELKIATKDLDAKTKYSRYEQAYSNLKSPPVFLLSAKIIISFSFILLLADSALNASVDRSILLNLILPFSLLANYYALSAVLYLAVQNRKHAFFDKVVLPMKDKMFFTLSQMQEYANVPCERPKYGLDAVLSDMQDAEKNPMPGKIRDLFYTLKCIQQRHDLTSLDMQMMNILNNNFLILLKPNSRCKTTQNLHIST